MDWTPLTTRAYQKRLVNGQGSALQEHGDGPVKQPIPYYTRVGWNRTKRGKKCSLRVVQIETPYDVTDPVDNPAFGDNQEATVEAPSIFKVHSQSKDKWYKVIWAGSSASSSCKCKDYKWNQVCKHIRAVRRWRLKTKDMWHGGLDYEQLDKTFASDDEDDMGNLAEQIDRNIKILQFGPDN